MALSPEALEARRKYIREYMRKYRKKNKTDDKYWERKARQNQVFDISIEMMGYISQQNK